MAAVYNGATQETSCTVNAPTITRSGYSIIGFNTSASATTNNSSYNTSTKKLTLTSSNDNKTWYAITMICNRWVRVGDQSPIEKQRWEFYRNCNKLTGWIYTSNDLGLNNPDSGLENINYVNWNSYLSQIYNSTRYKNHKDNFYYLNEYGYMISGWHYINGNWYYFNNNQIDDGTLMQNRSGMMYHDRIVGGNSDYKTTYGIWDKNKKIQLGTSGACDKSGDNACVNVWLRTGYLYEKDASGNWVNRRYWQYSGSDGKPYVNTTKTINGTSYTFDSKGRCTNNNYACGDSDINGYVY